MDFTQISDEALLIEMQRLVASEREATARLVACLAELDRRRLYLALGYTSLFKYCADALRLSEDATFARIEVARAAQRFPCLVQQLAAGDLTLTAIRLLAPHLTLENHRTLLAEAQHKGMKEIQLLIARHKPQPPVPSTIRRLPAPKSGAAEAVAIQEANPVAPLQTPISTTPSSPARRAVVAPLSEETYKVQFTIRKDVHDKLRRLQDLLRHQVPKGDPAVIFERAMDALLAEVLKKKTGAVARPRDDKRANPASRHIPARVRRAVWARDGGTCAFTATNGRRCGETGRLEYHHVVPYAAGGKTLLENIELRCTAHNRYEAEQFFGERVISLFRETAPPYGAGAAIRPSTCRRAPTASSISSAARARTGCSRLS